MTFQGLICSYLSYILFSLLRYKMDILHKYYGSRRLPFMIKIVHLSFLVHDNKVGSYFISFSIELNSLCLTSV